MKTHGPNSPQTVRGLINRRSQRGLLDTRRMAEADLRVAEYVGPFSKGFDLVKNPGGDTSYIVANLTGGRTVAPGAAVLLGSQTGLPGEARLGSAPAGKKGGISRTRSPRRRGSVSLAANQYAFGDDGVDMFAMLYQDGTFVSTRASQTVTGGGHTGCIMSDESETVGAGSLLMRNGSSLYVWDVEGEANYNYTAPGGWRLLTEAYYQNGKLYWIEGQDIVSEVTTSFDIRLRSSDTDLTGVATIQAVTRDIAGAQADLGGSTIEYFLDTAEYAAGIMVDADGAVVYFGVRPQDGNGERQDVWQTQFRFLLAGGAPSSREWDSPEGTTLSAVTLGGTSFAFALLRVDLGGNYVIMSKADNAVSAAADLWDSSTLLTYGFTTISVGTGGANVQVHSSGGFILRGAAIIATTIDLYDGANAPASMFFFGT